MTILNTGFTGSEASVTDGALHVKVRNADGSVTAPVLGVYTARINLDIGAALAADVTVWSMYNAGTRRARIRQLSLVGNFSGTAAATKSTFYLSRFSAGSPTGGANYDPSKVNSASTPNSTFENNLRFLVSGLTTTAATFEGNALDVYPVSNQLAVSAMFRNQTPIELNPGQGLAIRALGAIVAGASLNGSITWEEEAV